MYALFFILSFLSLNFFTQNRVNLKVMSYNIRYDNSEDGKNQWAYRRETLTNYFIKNKPDIIGMQEVLHSQLMDLTSSLNEYQYVGVGREDGKTKGEYSPIVYLKSKLKMVKTSTFWLSQTPEKFQWGGMQHWNGFVLMHFLKIVKPKSNFGYLILILITLEK